MTNGTQKEKSILTPSRLYKKRGACSYPRLKKKNDFLFVILLIYNESYFIAYALLSFAHLSVPPS